MRNETIVAVGSLRALEEWAVSGGYLYVVEADGGSALICGELCCACKRTDSGLTRCPRHLPCVTVGVTLIMVGRLR